MTAWTELTDDGRVSQPSALASVEELGGRLVVRLAGGLAFDVLPERGLDLGATWWGSTPLAWRSPNPVDPGPGRGWEERFLGGLLATCGPDNIGEPRGSSGQHGTHHLTPATEVRWSRERVGAAWQVCVTGTVAHTSLGGPRILVERSIVASTGTASVEVRDVVRNVGDEPVGVPLLYHVNLGAPLLRPGARTAHRHVLGDHEHPSVVVTWTGDTLPRLCTWSWPASGAYVLGVEPTNAPLFGPERDLPHAGAPILEPGATWRTGVRISVEGAS